MKTDAEKAAWFNIPSEEFLKEHSYKKKDEVLYTSNIWDNIGNIFKKTWEAFSTCVEEAVNGLKEYSTALFNFVIIVALLLFVYLAIRVLCQCTGCLRETCRRDSSPRKPGSKLPCDRKAYRRSDAHPGRHNECSCFIDDSSLV